MQIIRVIIVDADEDYRKTLTMLLNENGFKVTGSFHSAEFIGSTLPIAPDIAILEYSKPKHEKIVHELKKKFLGLKIIVTATFKGKPTAIDLKEQGIQGLHFKNTSDSKLIDTIRMVWDGWTHYSNRLNP